MTAQILYKECPLCTVGTVTQQNNEAVFQCDHCGLTIKEKSLFGIFKKGHYVVTDFGQGNFNLAQQGLLNKITLALDPLKITIGNVYTNEQLVDIAAGSTTPLRPVRTILAQIILEQLKEECFLQVTGLRRGHGQPLTDESDYLPQGDSPKQGMEWQDEGNLFCTTHRLVFPSSRFTFIRTDRKLVAVRAFNDGLAVQRKGEDYATYFIGCYPHEAALVAAYVIGKLPALRKLVADTQVSK